jgi:cytochrome P450
MATVDSIVANAGATGFFPEPMRYYVGRVICWSTHRRIDNLTRWYTDEFRERIHKLETNAPDQKVDLLQKMLRFARKNRPEELAVEQMTRRLCMTNLAFIYLASFTMTNIFSNVLSSDARHDTIAKLREEAETWLAKYPDDPRGLWTRSNTNQMVRADSVMREALRINTVPTRAIVRKVLVDGLVTDAGLKLPKDSLISFVSQPMHTDPERWTDPDTYDPFRFVRLREEEEEGRKAQALPEDAGGQFNPHSFLSTASLLVFGRGKNACPGRFLMDFQLKMVINYIVSNYDLRFAEQEPIERPPLPWTLEFIFPAKGVKFNVKRRKRIVTPTPTPAVTPAALKEEEEAVGSS